MNETSKQGPVTAAAPETPAVTLADAMAAAFTEPGMAALVKAAQLHDLACRPPGNWRRVSDHQAARLIAGALADLCEQTGMTPPWPAEATP